MIMADVAETVRTAGRARARVIRSAIDVEKMMRPRLKFETQEEVYAIMLNHASKVIDIHFVGLGTDSSAPVSIKHIVRWALDDLATAVILMHTHPSGSTLPSRQDDKITLDLKNALQYFEICLLDHVIIGDGYYSYNDNGRI